MFGSLAGGLRHLAGTAVTLSADGGELDTFITTIKGALSDFTTGTLGKVLVAGIGVSAALVICWFAFKFIKRKVMGALNKGGI